MQTNFPVQWESLWIRLHRSPNAFADRIEGTRTVQIFNESKLVAEGHFYLSSDEWILLRSGGIAGQGGIIGDTLVVSEGTDIDSIIISWGEHVDHALQTKETLEAIYPDLGGKATFNSFRVLTKEISAKEKEEGKADYSISPALNAVSKNLKDVLDVNAPKS